MNKDKFSNFLLGLILLFALSTRFYHYSTWSLSNDELSALLGFSYGSLFNNIFRYVATDFHPAGVQVLIWLWCNIFGTSVAALRLPFVLMGVASVYLVYINTKQCINKPAALLVSATLAVSQFAILYSQIARPYSSGLFFVLITWYGWNQFVFKEKHETPGLFASFIFVLGLVLCMYNHYFSFLMAAIMGLTGLFVIPKHVKKIYLICGIVAVVLFLPHLKISISQFSAGGIGWVSVPDKSFFWSFALYMFNQSKWYLFILLLIALVSAVKIPIQISSNKFRWIALLWFLLLLFIAYFYSIYVSPVLQYSILIFSYPFLLVFLFSYTPVQQKIVHLTVPLILVCGTIQIYAINKFSGSNEFGRFKEIAQHINEADIEFGSNQIESGINVTDSSYIHYYLSKLNNQHHFNFYHCANDTQFNQLVKLTQGSEKPYFLYCWSNSDCPPVINSIISQKYPFLIKRYWYFNSEFYLYSRKSQDSVNRITDSENIFIQNYSNTAAYFNKPAYIVNDTTDTLHTNNAAEFLNKDVLYSSTFRIGLNKLIKNTSDIIHAKVLIKNTSIDDDALIVFSIDHQGKNYYWSGKSIKPYLLQPEKWNRCFHSIRLPEIKSADDTISIYIYNQFNKTIFVDDFIIESEPGNDNLYGPRKDAYLMGVNAAAEKNKAKTKH
ncbi:MAG: glycosyltransferase family 39 protein [Bacteroidia bacterium]|nr:glycosyltransferase family 39 protein [Bacteroidia bacterium]MCZ2247668.1 glycosyltransferase family 39 protein [Bacteroidia bacterium]